MPSFHFKCECGLVRVRICSPEELTPPVCECGKTMVRNVQPPTTTITETLDNGVMARKVERFSEADRMVKERAQQIAKHEESK